jgi:formylglycine-generating enzyme required for sulfatase activity
LPKVPSGTRYAALAPDGRSLVLLDRDSDTLFHELPSGKKTGRARSGGPGAFALGGAELACADKGHVAIIDQVARKALAEKLMPHTGVEAVAVSDDGRRFVSVGKEPSAILWHAVTHREMASMRGHDGPALCGAISPDNGTVVTGGADGTVRTWDPMGGRMVVVGTGHAGRVTCLDFSPDGILLASGSEDRTIVLWEAPTLERPTRLCAFNDPVKAVLFTEDGAALYAFSTAGQARLWDIRGIFAIASQSPSKDSARAPRSEAGSGPEKAAPAAVPVKPKAVEPSVSGAPPGSPPVRAAPGLPTSNEFDRRFWLARAMEGARAVSDREVQPWLWRDVAIEQTHSGDGEGAKETARQHLGEGISKGYSLHTIALAQVEAQDVRGAVATARSIEDVAWRIKTLCAIARAEVASGKPQEARAVLDGLPSLITSDLIPLIDERYGIWFVLALAEAEVGDIHTAEALENNLRKDDLEKVRCAIAASLLLAGDVAAAKTRIDKIPTDSRSLVDFYLAMYRALAGQIDVAEAAAIDKEPKAGEVLAILAERCDRKGDLVNAAALVQKIQGLSQDPKVIDLSLKVMRSLADAGDPARIAAISGRVPERPELQAQALAALALAQVKSGSLGLADETFRKAEATAREVSSYLLRGRAIGAVAAARARTGDFRSLGEWLATIREPLELAYAHLGVSSTMPVPRGPKAEPVAGWPTAAARIQKIQLGPIAMDFVEVPAGTFLRDGKTIHLAKSLLMGRCEVTQDQWTAVMGSNPAQRKNSGSLPVDSVSWQDCQEFCNRIHGPSGRKVRLPSEAEWEYAARAGTTQVYFFGPSERWADLNAHAWWRGNSKGESHPVGQMVPNPWGLCDVLGNVAEWCQDVWHFTFSRAPTDGSAWMDGVSRSETDFHVVRGGSFGDGPEELTIPRRSQTNFGLRSPRLGLRVVIEP